MRHSLQFRFPNLLVLLTVVFSVACLLPATASAELTLAPLLTDHAILQQGMPVPIRGSADPHATVTVEFAGQKRSASVDAEGHWSLKLDAMEASFESQTLSVRCGEEVISLDDVLIGEVWICSGQSNMQMGWNGIPDVKKLASKAKNIRRFLVKQTVAFEQQSDCEGNWSAVPPGSAVALSFAYHLEEMIEAPIGIVQTAWGSSSLEGWMPRDLTEQLPHFNEIMKTFDADQERRTRIETLLSEEKWDRKSNIFLRTQPNILYNAMMHPLAPYACRGIVWYQGEANAKYAGDMIQYRDSLKSWIPRYRKLWDREDLNFLIVMLPGYGKIPPQGPSKDHLHPSAHSFAWIRESQLKSQELPNVAVANTIDLGAVKNIHPKDKLPVGQRLAFLAAEDIFKMDIESRGPVMAAVEVAGNELVVRFDHADGLKTKDGEAPRSFWLADESGSWFAATAAEIEGSSIRLSSAKLSNPLYVRYAFSGKPDVNLVNEADLPAYPFRNDSFKP